MKYLQGFKEYLGENYLSSAFDTAGESQNYWTFHLHDHQVITAKVTRNLTYDVELTDQDQAAQTIPKTRIKLFYPSDTIQAVQKAIKVDAKVKSLGLEPIVAARPRFHVKNKSLYVLMKERQVVFFTLLEGEIVRGLIADFTRYDITVHLKGQTPVTLLRHSIYNLKDKKERCHLKSFQEVHKDWKSSPLYVTVDL